jgi:hypothetical protein
MPMIFRTFPGLSGKAIQVDENTAEVNYGADISILARMIEAGES